MKWTKLFSFAKLIKVFSYRTMQSFNEIKYSSIIVFYALIPIVTTSILISIFVNSESIELYENFSLQNENPYNPKHLVIYLSVASAHFILSIFTILYLRNHIVKDWSIFKLGPISYWIIFYITLITFLYLVFDRIGIDIAILSHERVYNILYKSSFFEPYFISIPNDIIPWLNFDFFYLFSLDSFVLILLGIMVVVFGAFSIGKEVKAYRNTNVEDAEHFIQKSKEIISSMKNYVFILSIILVTSSVATILYFQIPLPLVEKTELKDTYQGVSYAMGFCWGSIFSLTLFTICIYPFWIIHKKMKTAISEGDLIDNYVFKVWYEKDSNLFRMSSNIKTIFSILSPVAATIFTQLLTSKF